MSNTKIEWATKTWDPFDGCHKVSAGCEFCYAERQWPRLAGNKATRQHGRKFTDVKTHDDLLDVPFKWKKPERIFVGSKGDMFHKEIPDSFIREIWSVMAQCPQHTFIILTKRPERMQEIVSDPVFIEAVDIDFVHKTGALPHDPAPEDLVITWPLPNVWLGVSVEDQKTADKRIFQLLATPAAKRIISYEPALGPIDFKKFLVPPSPKGAEGASSLDWIIAGGESGPNARPAHPQWFRTVRDQCAQAHIPFFFKQWGEWIPQGHLKIDRVKMPIDRFKSHHCKTLDCVSAGTETDCRCWRVGKKAAGHLLDGVEYFQFPEEKLPLVKGAGGIIQGEVK